VRIKITNMQKMIPKFGPSTSKDRELFIEKI